MLFISLAIAAAALGPTPDTVEVSPAVRAIAAKYGKEFGAEAERELESLSTAGDRTAAALLGELYMFPNRPGGRDLVKSCNFSELAGQHASALHNLATCYYAGTGRPQDRVKARALYAEASALGFAKGHCALGNMLIGGHGGPREIERGLALCKRGADAGDPDAQTDYGGYVLMGEHLPKDAKAAIHYLGQAAAKRQPNAAYLLGQIYWKGDGIEKDNQEAAKWWKVAHEAGRPDAAELLGREVIARMAQLHQKKQNIPVALLNDAIGWFSLTEKTDPDAKARSKATEMLDVLRKLRAVKDKKAQ